MWPWGRAYVGAEPVRRLLSSTINSKITSRKSRAATIEESLPDSAAVLRLDVCAPMSYALLPSTVTAVRAMTFAT